MMRRTARSTACAGRLAAPVEPRQPAPRGRRAGLDDQVVAPSRCRRPRADRPRRAPRASPRCARSRGRGGRRATRASSPSRREPGEHEARRWRADRSPSPARPRAPPGRARRAVCPSTRMSAPMRTSSCACRKRFSKIVSVKVLVPSARVIERHELRLQVGREARDTAWSARRRRASVPVRLDPHAAVVLGAPPRPSRASFVTNASRWSRARARARAPAARDGGRDHEACRPRCDRG